MRANAAGDLTKYIIARDGQCRVCHRPVVQPGSRADVALWSHVHQIRHIYRSAHWVDERDALILLCGACVEAEQRGMLRISGDASHISVASSQGDGQP